MFTGITCNLACTLCGPGASSRWRAELGHETFPDTDPDIDVQDCDFSNLEHVTFTGGEPLLNRSTLEILQRLDSRVSVQLHSNTTVLPSEEYLTEFARFSNIIVMFSVDDIEQQFEYLRWPARWSDAAANMLWFRENCPDNVMFAVNTVVSLLNSDTHLRVQAWVQRHFPTNRSGVPIVCNVNESNGLLNRKQVIDSRDPVEYLDSLDRRRNTNWRKTFPDSQIIRP